MNYSATILTMILFSMLITGCTRSLKKEIETAEQAITEAKKAEAVRFAPNTFKKSEETFTMALGELARENKKLLGKNYTKATVLLAEAADLAQSAVKETMELKNRTVEEATKAEAETAVNTVYAAYKKAKKTNGNGRLLPQAMDLLKKAQTAMSEGNYQGAVDFAQQADAKLKTN